MMIDMMMMIMMMMYWIILKKFSERLNDLYEILQDSRGNKTNAQSWLQDQWSFHYINGKLLKIEDYTLLIIFLLIFIN